MKTMFISAFLLTQIACTTQISEKNGELGIEATETDVQSVLADATKGISPFQAKVGQSVNMEFNARIETNAVMKLQEISRRVAAIRENDENITYVYFEDYYEYTPSGTLVDEWHKDRPWVFPKGGQVVASAAQRFENFFPNSRARTDGEDNLCDGKMVKDKDGTEYDCLKYFNLKSERRKVPAPEAILNKPGCLGLPDCLITVQHVEYDEVKWKNGDAVDKISMSANISREIPYLFPDLGIPPVTSLCTRVKQDFDKQQNVRVTYCRILRNLDI